MLPIFVHVVNEWEEILLVRQQSTPTENIYHILDISMCIGAKMTPQTAANNRIKLSVCARR